MPKDETEKNKVEIPIVAALVVVALFAGFFLGIQKGESEQYSCSLEEKTNQDNYRTSLSNIQTRTSDLESKLECIQPKVNQLAIAAQKCSGGYSLAENLMPEDLKNAFYSQSTCKNEGEMNSLIDAVNRCSSG